MWLQALGITLKIINISTILFSINGDGQQAILLMNK